MRVAYLGPEYSHSHEQAKDVWPDACLVPRDKFPDVIHGVADGDFDCGVIPFHNTSGQSVKDAQHALHAAGAEVSVTAVRFRKIVHSIGGFGSLAETRIVSSKDIVFEQCKKWLKANLPDVECRHMDSTSLAIRTISASKQQDELAIGTNSAFAAYGVPMLQQAIQNVPNATLFFEIRRRVAVSPEWDNIIVSGSFDDARQQFVMDEFIRQGLQVNDTWWLAPHKQYEQGVRFFSLRSFDHRTAGQNLHAGLPMDITLIGGYVGRPLKELKEQCQAGERSTP